MCVGHRFLLANAERATNHCNHHVETWQAIFHNFAPTQKISKMKTTLNTHARLRRDLARVSDLADATAELTDAIEHLADAIENMPTATSVQEHQIDTLIHTVQLAIAGRSSSVSIGNSNSI